MRYLRKCTWKTEGDKIISQIRGIFNQELVTKMVDNRKLRWFGHLIRTDRNMKLRQVRETRVELTWGRGRPRIEWEEHMRKVRREREKREDLARDEGEESITDLGDATRCLGRATTG
jgi:hypothetical protein